MAVQECTFFVFTLFSPVSRIIQLGGLAESCVFWNAISYPKLPREDHKVLRVHALLKMSEMSNAILFKVD